jgi:hypothetical protein
MPQDQPSPSQILREATDRFVGKRGVIGVGWGGTGANHLVVFFEHRDADQEHKIQVWAKRSHVDVEFLIAGRFVAGSAA